MKKIVHIQRAEGAALLAFSLYTYNRFDLDWWLFIVLLFAFDISMLGYLYNKRVGAYLYNLGHALVLPFILWILAWELESSVLVSISLIWLAHIGIDRLFAYGLKTDKGFRHTHLGKIGKD